jgi:hypothetical protein
MGSRVDPPADALKNSRRWLQFALHLSPLSQQSAIGNQQFFTPNHT